MMRFSKEIHQGRVAVMIINNIVLWFGFLHACSIENESGYVSFSGSHRILYPKVARSSLFWKSSFVFHKSTSSIIIESEGETNLRCNATKLHQETAAQLLMLWRDLWRRFPMLKSFSQDIIAVQTTRGKTMKISFWHSVLQRRTNVRGVVLSWAFLTWKSIRPRWIFSPMTCRRWWGNVLRQVKGASREGGRKTRSSYVQNGDATVWFGQEDRSNYDRWLQMAVTVINWETQMGIIRRILTARGHSNDLLRHHSECKRLQQKCPPTEKYGWCGRSSKCTYYFTTRIAAHQNWVFCSNNTMPKFNII